METRLDGGGHKGTESHIGSGTTRFAEEQAPQVRKWPALGGAMVRTEHNQETGYSILKVNKEFKSDCHSWEPYSERVVEGLRLLQSYYIPAVCHGNQ